jgi:membrane protease YdiL (CAAX protease family)
LVAALALVIALLGAHNLLGNLVLPSALYIPANLAMTAALVGIARARGISWAELGLSRPTARRGVALGLAAFAVIAIVLVTTALIPTTRPLFDDQRAAHLSGAAAAYHALVRIPLGTVVLEEVAFRGVLLSLFRRVTSAGAAVGWSSALFGLWHVVPTIEALRANQLDPAALGVIGAVVVTAAGGVIFCWLRVRSGSLIAPALAHIGTNSVSLVVSVLVLRRASGL